MKKFYKMFIEFCERCDEKGYMRQEDLYRELQDYPKMAWFMWFAMSRYHQVSFEYGTVCYRNIDDLLASGVHPKKTKPLIVFSYMTDYF